MTTSELRAGERIKSVRISEDAISVDLADGRTISAPLAWYPRLLHATAQQRENWRIAGGGYGIHWPDLDEDLSAQGLLQGAPAPPWQERGISPAHVSRSREPPKRMRPAGRVEQERDDSIREERFKPSEKA